MSQHQKHKIQEGDTLHSITKRYTITAEELRRYHNTYCEVSDQLAHEITHQKELLIANPESVHSSEGIKRKNVHFAPNNNLVYSPINSIYKYGVMITLENGEEKNVLQYETAVKWIQKLEGLHAFGIDRISRIYLNEEEVSDIADTLAYKTSRVLYPMQILVNQEGQWQEAVEYNRYPERWETVKEDIRKEFEGETVEEYLLKIEKILETPELITRYISGDLFIRTLFLGYCIHYGTDFTTEKHITFPIIDNGVEPRYKIQVTADPLLDEYNLITIKMEGVLDDERSQADFINGNPLAFQEKEEKETVPFGGISVQAFLNPNSRIPEAIHLECSMDLKETKKVTIVIANLSETGSIHVWDREDFVFGSETAPKKSFWSGVFK